MGNIKSIITITIREHAEQARNIKDVPIQIWPNFQIKTLKQVIERILRQRPVALFVSEISKSGFFVTCSAVDSIAVSLFTNSETAAVTP